MTYILIILKVQVRLKKKIGLFCKKNYIFTLFKKRNISLYRDIFGAMHRYFQILYRPISTDQPLIVLTFNCHFLSACVQGIDTAVTLCTVTSFMIEMETGST